MEQQIGSKLGKEYVNAVYCHPVNLTYMQSTSWEMPDWMSSKLESRLLEEILKPQIWRSHHPYGRKLRGTKEPLDEGESGEGKHSLKLSIQNMKIMAFSPITPWQIDGETMETVTDFIFFGSKITVDGDCRHEIKRRKAAPWKKSYSKPRHCIKKQRHHFPNKDPSHQSYGFSCMDLRVDP